MIDQTGISRASSLTLMDSGSRIYLSSLQRGRGGLSKAYPVFSKTGRHFGKLRWESGEKAQDRRLAAALEPPGEDRRRQHCGAKEVDPQAELATDCAPMFFKE